MIRKLSADQLVPVMGDIMPSLHKNLWTRDKGTYGSNQGFFGLLRGGATRSKPEQWNLVPNATHRVIFKECMNMTLCSPFLLQT